MSRIQGLERYITDDVIRHGNRLSELEKKITNVYQELTSSEAIDDDALFANEDDEEEESAFVMYALCLLALAGTDADMVIFAQGSIHRRHWRGLSWSARAWYRCRTRPFLSLDSKASPQRQEECQRPECCVWSLFSPATPCPNALFSSHSAKSAEPPPPYPPPPPFVPLTVGSVKSQIGLLRGYYEHRLTSAVLDSLPDDSPNPAQAKLGPLGQVIRPSSAAIAAAAAGSKKKSKPKDAAAATAAPGVNGATVATIGTRVAGMAITTGIVTGAAAGVVPPATPVLSPQTPSVSLVVSGGAGAATAMPAAESQPQAQTPKKKKAASASVGGGAAGAGAGGGGTGKKRGRPPEGLPPVVVASA